MTQTKSALENGAVEVLSEAARRMPIRFDRQCLLNHDAVTRPWDHFPAHFPRTIFSPDCLTSYETTVRSRLLEAIRTQPALIRPRRVKVRTGALESVFGRFSEGHAFLALNPDWGIRLHEPQATSGLAYLLNRGTGRLRALRIRAFLEALGIQKLPDNQTLERGRGSLRSEPNRS